MAEVLLNLAERIDEAAEVVERLLATPEENVKRFKRRLAGLKRGRKFVDWREAPNFARKLEGMLANLREGADTPETGVELIAAFYRCDRSVFERCDDSSGMIGDVFRYDARILFVRYAAACVEKDWLRGRLLELYENDDYGVRHSLLEVAPEFLPERTVYKLISQMWERAEAELPGSFDADHWRIGVRTLARQMKDAEIYEKAWLASSPDPSAGVCMDIAEVYVEADDPKVALHWMERIPESNKFQAIKQDSLLFTIYKQLGDREGMTKVAWRIFLNHRSADNLQTLLSTIGESEGERVVGEQIKKILEGDSLSYSDAQFLVEIEKVQAAEDYILSHAAELDGDLYPQILSLTKPLEEAGCLLGAVALYRALLESILRRAVSRYYHHGVRYLKKLDALGSRIDDWRDFTPHESYKEELLEKHARKHSFWARYEA
ncbi:MAG: hypothetical protein U9N00_02820 [Candidatus Bipolaricaulota bacterium]|nr:hypothetical protein [Candidatus Bipolaricaulota bacterium]